METGTIQNDLDTTILTMQNQLETLQKFISRRFDELSMEVNATSQQMDMTEGSIISRFGEIMEALSAISFHGNALTPANAGVDLEAVIETTENAANKILDAADRIAERVEKEKDWDDEKSRAVLRESITKDVQDILMACTFQDLAGQRIRKTLENLHTIEDRLGATLEKLGVNIAVNQKEATEKAVGGELTSQNEIDNLFD